LLYELQDRRERGVGDPRGLTQKLDLVRALHDPQPGHDLLERLGRRAQLLGQLTVALQCHVLGLDAQPQAGRQVRDAAVGAGDDLVREESLLLRLRRVPTVGQHDGPVGQHQDGSVLGAREAGEVADVGRVGDEQRVDLVLAHGRPDVLQRRVHMGLRGRGDGHLVPSSVAPRPSGGVARIMSSRSAATRLAPPIKPPSTSVWASSSSALLGFMLPPYSTLTSTPSDSRRPSSSRTATHISRASSAVAVRPVPMAHTGSYATTSRSADSTCTPSSAPRSCERTTERASPASRWSRLSPTQSTGTRSAASARSSLARTSSSPSAWYWRLSECPITA